MEKVRHDGPEPAARPTRGRSTVSASELAPSPISARCWQQSTPDAVATVHWFLGAPSDLERWAWRQQNSLGAALEAVSARVRSEASGARACGRWEPVDAVPQFDWVWQRAAS